MKKSDKVIIEFDYNYQDHQFTEEIIESMINMWIKRIEDAIKEPSSPLYFNAMALANIDIKKVLRTVDIEGKFCQHCGFLKKESYNTIERMNCTCKKQSK